MRALLMDTETTGLVENRSVGLDRLPEVIEFYGVLADLGKPRRPRIRELEHLIRPARALSDVPGRKGGRTITQITGITNAMLEEVPRFGEVAVGIFAFIKEAPVIIAQNASFDVEMLDIEAERLGTKIEWPPVLCTVEQTVHYRGYRLTLGDLHEHLLGERFPGAHRARADTEALLRICLEMRKRGDL